jgi:hypothetical protein
LLSNRIFRPELEDVTIPDVTSFVGDGAWRAKRKLIRR